MMNLAEYRRPLPTASPTSCPGRRWSTRASSSTRTARSSGPRSFAGPTSIAPRRPNWSPIAGRLNNALRRLGSGWAIFVEAQRQPADRYPRQPFPGRGLAPGRCRAAGPVRGGGRALREQLLPDASLSAAGRGRRARRSAGSTRAATAPTAPTAREALRGFVDRTDRVLAPRRGLHAGVRLAR